MEILQAMKKYRKKVCTSCGETKSFSPHDFKVIPRRVWDEETRSYNKFCALSAKCISCYEKGKSKVKPINDVSEIESEILSWMPEKIFLQKNHHMSKIDVYDIGRDMKPLSELEKCAELEAMETLTLEDISQAEISLIYGQYPNDIELLTDSKYLENIEYFANSDYTKVIQYT